MLARTAATPVRSGAGYVCLACRRERIVSARQSQQQRRWNSESVGPKTSSPPAEAEAPDEWLLPLNSFSEEFGDKKPSESGRRKARAARPSNDEHGEADGVQKDNAGGRTTRRQRVQESRPALSKPMSTSGGRGDVKSLLRSLDRANDGEATSGQGGQAAISRARDASTVPPDKSIGSRASTTSSNAAMQKLWDQLGPGIKEEIDAIAAEDGTEGNEAQYDEYLEKSAAASVPEPEVKSKEPVPFPSFLSQESPSTPVSSPGFFSSAFNYVKEKVGFSKPSQSEQTSVERKDQENRAADASKRVGKRTQSVESTFESVRLSRTPTPFKSPVERFQESSNRQPWGPSTPKTPDRAVASFDDIASADRISVQKPIATRVSKKPFGIEPAQTIADLRGQLKQTLASPTSDEVAVKEEAKAALSSKEEAEATSSNVAHSRLSGLYATRSVADQTGTEPSAGVVDTLDLAYLRRQYDQDRAQQDVKASIRKSFPEVSVTDSGLDQAVDEEAKRALKARSRPGRRIGSKSLNLPYTSETTLASSGASLGAAMRAGTGALTAPPAPKRKVGRPAKKPATLIESKALETDEVSDETAQIVSQPLDSPSPLDSADESTSADGFRTTTPSQLHITPLDIPQPPVPYLQYGLDRVLFNPGVYQLQDRTSRVYNFDPYLENIMPNVEFDFDSLKEYKTSSKDEALATIAREHGNKYIGSTSSMTSALGHFHYLLSNWRPLNFGMLSNDFVTRSSKALPNQLTQINRAPTAIFLRWKNGTYAIDADKEHDSANVLMLLGKSMELLLTLPKSDFERYRKSDPREVSEEQRTAPESYQYTTMRDFLMRSQLDAYDPRLPGNGTFDLKTRAVVSVRMAADDHEPMTGYEIYGRQGKWGSYEKEYYDMMRSTMLKYMLQARMGRMNGIFVAYHNVERMFGFQYIPIADMDRALHGQADPCLGDQEFRASLDMLNEALNAATAKYPEQSLRIHFETKEHEGEGGMPVALHIFAEPMSEEDCDKIQNSQKAKIAEWENTVMGKSDAQAEDTQPANLSADEVKSSDFSNEVTQDEAAIIPEDESSVEEVNVTVTASDDDAEAYARSLLQSSEEVPVEDAVQATTDNSSSNADPKFLNALATSDSEELKPLFYATIIAQSSVNGQVVSVRPHNLKPTDEWTIEYILKEYDIGRLQWGMYEDLKARRKVAYVKEEEEGVEKEENGFLNFLRRLSEEGRVIRKKKDEKDDGLPVVRVEELDMERLETVDSVEDYMKFLEKPKVEGTREMFG